MAIKAVGSNQAIRACGACRKVDDKLQQCARCHLQKYCSRECQTAHWPEHKAVCQLWEWTKIEQEADSWLERKNDGASGSTDGEVFAHDPQRVFPAVENFFNREVSKKLAYDLGCGTGATTLYLLNLGWRVIAVDFNQTALDQLVEKADKIWLEPKQLVTHVANIEEFEFTEKAHLIVVNDVFPYCNPKKMSQLWNHIFANLEPGGHIAATFFERGDNFVWASYGAWFVDHQAFVEGLVKSSKYTVEMCRYRPKNYKSSVIEFIGKKSV
jgi:SAM-dependent methyltransferase